VTRSTCRRWDERNPSSRAAAQWSTSGGNTWTNDNVGINHSNPTYPLHVKSDGGYGAARIEAGAGTTAKRGLVATSWANTGTDAIAVSGDTYSTGGTGVKGVALANSGVNYGIYGASNSGDGFSGYFAGGKFHVISGFASISRATPINSTEVFGVTAKTHSWGGMYMSTWSDGLPYYGYAIDNTAKAYHWYDSGSNPWRLWLAGTRLAVDGTTGYVGIGTTAPEYLLHVAGDAGKPGGGSWSTASDRRLKRDVRPMEGALERLLTLHGVSFEYRDPETIGELPGRHLGVIAQEVEPAFPEWVDLGRDGYRRVTFRGFEADAIEALRELRHEARAETTALRRENEHLRGALAEQTRALQSLAERLAALEASTPGAGAR